MLTLIFLTVDATIASRNISQEERTEEIRFIYISYIEYLSNFSNTTSSLNKVKIDKMLDNIAYYKFNNIFLHTNPFSDAIYPSKYFPYSHTLTNIEGKNPGFDYLEYFISKAHARNIKVHAWINPYRVSSNNNLNSLSENNPAISLQKSGDIGISDKGVYYNPTSESVKNLIISAVEELINNYDIDGIHFDDYFYVDYNVDKNNYTNYQQNGGKKSLKEYRLEHTTDLVKRVSQITKQNHLIFSISPDGNINNNYAYHYADVKEWISNEYIDYIMPQLYYGFENQYWPFIKAYNDWHNLTKDTNVKLIPTLAIYKVGQVDDNAGTGKNEWLQTGIINKQITFLKSDDDYYGFGLFRYDYLFSNYYSNKILDEEIKNIYKIM